MLSTSWDIQFPFGVDSSSAMSSSMFSWDKFDHRALGYIPSHRLNHCRFHRIRCLLHSFVIVEGDFEWLGDDWNDHTVFLRVPFGVTLPSSSPFQSHSHQSRCYPLNWNLHHRHWNHVLFAVLWISGKNLRRSQCAGKDGCCFGPLGLRGLCLRLGVPFTFTLGDWPWCVSKSEQKKSLPSKFLQWSRCTEAAWSIYTNSIFVVSMALGNRVEKFPVKRDFGLQIWGDERYSNFNDS